MILKSNRIESLDTVRGLAASSVVIHHCLLTFPIFLAANFLVLSSSQRNPWILAFTHSPLHFLWDGHEAVILFFVLSGFVLALPYLRHKPQNYAKFVIKRFCRIYIPYLFVAALSAVLMELHFRIANITFSNLSLWFQSMWLSPITLKMIFHVVLMVPGFEQNLDTTTWSLVHEMRISLVFPLVALFVKRFKAPVTLSAGVLLLVVGFKLSFLNYGFGDSLYYCGFFLFGATLAKYIESIGRFYLSLRPGSKVTIILLGVILYNWTWFMPNFGSRSILRYFNEVVPTSDFLVSVASMIFMSLAIFEKRLTVALKSRVPIWLGKISYSLYLVHPVVLLALVYGLHNVVPIWVSVLLVPPVSLLMAHLLYVTIERPSTKFGRRLATQLFRTTHAHATKSSHTA